MEKRISQRNSQYLSSNRIDYGVILPVFLLCLVGMTSLYTALSHDPNNPSVLRGLLMQGLWYALGTVAIVLIMQMKSKWLWRLTPYIYGLGLAVMLALLKFYDKSLAASTGSRNWFRITGNLTFQPAELMKIAFIMMLALVVTSHNVKHKNRTLTTDWELIGKMLAVTLPVVGLVLAQKDFGTMLVFLAIFGGVFLMSGISWRIIIPALAIMVILAGGVLFLVMTDTGRDILTHIGFQEYQFKRIDSWLDPFHDIQGDSMQQAYGMMAIGSGQMVGKGFNVSDVYVPVRESDMIFTVIGENFGFIGSAFVILLYFLLIYQMIKVCYDTNNEFYTYISSGIIMMLLFHVFENIGANIGLLPLTGIPLPFISQGGSSILSNMIGIGLILSMPYQAGATKA
ncbi:FtsW/RodA/SpoVE family cell cycle protein [Enterococcus asini]|uniref:Rod shape determining protein RodA n=2 Tax=Enterococcus asini TaxID=57732 RepID=R2S4N8_9ENTE|nr:FtsW/RodA/SpoVE family cell cycle protein [Enterococcus asini]EOH90450.1 rod shape determining protein RodA [Enterococcus asini ATCC 700915]EOT56918.1 rod shape determining protein RodA [Enterococcus asini ATCC 700915]MCD5027902.1 FtsW/RodA/SpoVE family cell cycle protein [Enterococcus asini]MDT2743737.1 FtsW/RodA/SpoVE family cell cycle protein [Enterococcus asini]MDT2763608.1 FtsW/RodA/SpoVE family cell cycle protein [Enterococcus asini]